MVTVWARIGSPAMANPTGAAASVFAIAFIVRTFGNRAPPDSGEGRINSIFILLQLQTLKDETKTQTNCKKCTLMGQSARLPKRLQPRPVPSTSRKLNLGNQMPVEFLRTPSCSTNYLQRFLAPATNGRSSVC